MKPLKSKSPYLVIISGGSGTRFWPKSTAEKPKQLLQFGPMHRSLLQQTADRFEGWIPKEQQLVVTTQLLKSPILEQLPQIEVLAEPQGRNTAACVFWSAKVVASRDPEAVILVMPSDHFIGNPKQFIEATKKAVEWAQQSGELCTLGISPTRPETGYGYIKLADEIQAGVFRVDRFVEKPQLEKAKSFLESGQYLWNSGMFVWKASAILEAFAECMPEMEKTWNQVFTSHFGRDQAAHDGKDLSDPEFIEKVYPLLTATSIDFGVMEKAKRVSCLPLDCGWDDLGAWTSVESIQDVLGLRTPSGAVLAGKVVAIESTGNIVDVPGKTVALLGVEDLIIAEANGSLLIAKKSQAQRIKEIVETLSNKH